ncbi:MAG: hypothetical protein ACFB51_15955, partial [Anaerolineae bacterium]
MHFPGAPLDPAAGAGLIWQQATATLDEFAGRAEVTASGFLTAALFSSGAWDDVFALTTGRDTHIPHDAAA